MSNPALGTPTSPYLRRTTLLSLGVGLAGAALAIAATPSSHAERVTIELAPPALHDEPRAASITDTARDDAAPIALAAAAPTYATIRIGGETYVKLAPVAPEPDGDSVEDEEGEAEAPAMAMPRHGKLRGFELATYGGDAVASVDARDAGTFAGWQGKQLVVGTNCRAQVTGFAVAASFVGDPFAVGSWDGEGTPPAFTAKDVFKYGDRMLVAKLSTSCAGRFAREVTAPRAAALTELTATASQIAAARAALVASDVGRQLNDAWAEAGTKLAWDADPEMKFTTKLYRHATTGKVFASVHAANGFACGGNEANIWGLYQVEGDVLVPVVERGLEGITEILELVDVDGDGTPDMIGKGYLGLGTQIQLADGTVTDGIDVDYVGCPC